MPTDPAPIDPIYRAQATSQGGRHGQVTTPDGVLDLALVRPVEMGGDPDARGTDPEQLFAAGYSACFHASLLHAAGLRSLELASSSVTATVGIGPADGGLGLAVDIEVDLPGTPEETARKLVARAHALCPYSRATRGNVPVTVRLASDRVTT